MKTTLLKIAALSIVITAISIGTTRANDYLYVYAPNGAVQTFALNDLQKMTFTEQAVNLHLTNSSTSSLFYDNVSVITFEAKETSAIPEIVSDLKVYRNGEGAVVINSTEEINAVYLYNMQGALLQQLAPATTSANLPLSALPAGLYLVRVTDKNNKTTTHKIINP